METDMIDMTHLALTPLGTEGHGFVDRTTEHGWRHDFATQPILPIEASAAASAFLRKAHSSAKAARWITTGLRAAPSLPSAALVAIELHQALRSLHCDRPSLLIVDDSVGITDEHWGDLARQGSARKLALVRAALDSHVAHGGAVIVTVPPHMAGAAAPSGRAEWLHGLIVQRVRAVDDGK